MEAEHLGGKKESESVTETALNESPVKIRRGDSGGDERKAN